MYCFECGTRLPDGAADCSGCGTPKEPWAPPPEPGWEACKVGWEARKARGAFERDKFVFVARAEGPGGPYAAGESGAFTLDPRSPHGLARRQMRPHLDGLVERLRREGWEPQPPGPDWWGFRFRRRVATPAA